MLVVYLRVPIPIYGTLWILLIAYVTSEMAYGIRFASAPMHQVGDELEESAQTSGASWWQTFRRVLLPLLLPALLAGWLYVFVASARELSSSILLYSPGNEVVSIRIWELYQQGYLTQLAALGVMMVVVLVGLDCGRLPHRRDARDQTAMTHDSLLVVDRLSKSFPDRHGAAKGRIVAVDDVSFAVRPGELFTLLGPSGCGKTTILRCDRRRSRRPTRARSPSPAACSSRPLAARACARTSAGSGWSSSRTRSGRT